MNQDETLPKSAVFYGVFLFFFFTVLFSALIGWFSPQILSDLVFMVFLLLFSLAFVGLGNDLEVPLLYLIFATGYLCFFAMRSVLGLPLLVICSSLITVTTGLAIGWIEYKITSSTGNLKQLQTFTVYMVVLLMIFTTAGVFGVRAVKEHHQKVVRPEKKIARSLSCQKTEEGKLITVDPAVFDQQAYLQRKFRADGIGFGSLEKRQTIRKVNGQKRIKELSYLSTSGKKSTVKIKTDHIFAPNIEKEIKCSGN